MLSKRKLHDDVDQSVLEPVGFGRNHAGPSPAAAPVDFAALHRIVDVVAAGITRNIADLRVQHAFQDLGKHIFVCARTRATDNEFLLAHVLECFDA